MPIRQLPPDIVSKIAAGEIIERPCFALKELLENAIDAKSTIIDIEADNVGLDRLAVIDNGHGMPPDELHLAHQRHTTSKISDLDDLHNISTMGFRGEALAAIAAVSTLTIRSKPVSQISGHYLTIQHGIEKATAPTGMSNGTHIIVDHLFSNLPARKKFLRNTQTEYRYLLDTMTNIALAHPQLEFSFNHNGRRIFTLSQHSLETRIQTLLGSELQSQLVPFESTSDYLHINGYIGRPQIATRTSQKQYIYVNNRRILSSAIANAVRNAYGTLLEATAQPVFIIFLKLRPEQIDVNVHPRKETVYFLNQSDIITAISDSVTKALATHNLTYIDSRWRKEPVEDHKTHSYTHLKHTLNNESANLLKEKVLTEYYGSSLKTSADIVQLHKTYLITETETGIIILDQHAAHERVLYEKFLQAFNDHKSSGASFQLPTAMIIEASLSDVTVINESKVFLQNIGFRFDATEEKRIVLTHVPIILKDHPIQQLLSETIDDLREEKLPNLDVRSHRMLSYLACRSAIMAGEKLTKERMKTLFEEVAQCKTEYTCPHGRPVKVEIPLSSMHKLFKRL